MFGHWGEFDRSFALLDDLRRRFDWSLQDFETHRPFAGTRDWVAPLWGGPRIEVQDVGDAFVFSAELPGVSEKDLQVSLENDTLTISGARAEYEAQEGLAVHRRERAPFRFSRTYTLPVRVDGEKTTAELKDGILTLRLEKAQEAKKKQIAIKAA